MQHSTKDVSSLIILSILYVYFLADMATGALLLNGYGVSVSLGIKTILFVLMLFWCFKQVKVAYKIMLIAIVCLISVSYNVILGRTGFLFFSNLFKLFFCLTMFCYFKLYWEKWINHTSASIIKINNFYLVINFFLGLLGMGYSTYRTRDIGIKGFFYAGNELSVVLFCLFVYKYLMGKRKYSILLFYCAIALLIGTKTAVLSILLYFILIILLNAEKKSYFVGVIVVIFLVALVVFNLERIGNIGVVKEQLQMLRWKYNVSNNFADALLSGRITFAKMMLSEMKEGRSIISILFGHGGFPKAAEIDLFDTFFSYGIIIAFLITAFYIRILWDNRKNKELFIFNSIYFFLSLTAGHVWFNTTSILVFCIINLGHADNRSIQKYGCLLKKAM